MRTQVLLTIALSGAAVAASPAPISGMGELSDENLTIDRLADGNVFADFTELVAQTGTAGSAPFTFTGSVTGEEVLHPDGSFEFQIFVDGQVLESPCGTGSYRARVEGTGTISPSGDAVGVFHENTIDDGASPILFDLTGTVFDNTLTFSGTYQCR